MNEEEYLKILNRLSKELQIAQEKYNKGRISLDTLWNSFNNIPPPAIKVENKITTTENTQLELINSDLNIKLTRYSGLKKDVRKAISAMDKSFNKDDLYKWIQENIPSSKATPIGITNTLFKLEKINEIECIEKGSGRKSSIYQKASW